jgi:hypothetical protein
MLCTHLVYAFAILNIPRNAIESSSPADDLDKNNRTGWCRGSTLSIAICVNLSQVQQVQRRTADFDTVLGLHIELSACLVASDAQMSCGSFSNH